MSQERARQLLRAARVANRDRSRMEQAMGYTTPEDGPADALLRTCMCAFWCALVTKDWEMAAEGYAMLSELHEMVTGGPFTPRSCASCQSSPPGPAGGSG